MNIGRVELCNYHITSVLLLVFSLTGCTKNTISEVSVLTCDQYKYHQQQDNLALAIDPILESKRANTYFGMDLPAHGILPVLIVVENHHSTTPFLLKKEMCSLLFEKNVNIESESIASDREPMMPYSENAIKLNQAGAFFTKLVPLSLAAFVPAIILGGSGGSQIQLTKAINESLETKSFVDRSLFPGEMHSGFLYFKINDDIKLLNISRVSIDVVNMLSHNTVSFDFQIQ